MVEEFRAVVTIEALQRKGQIGLNILDLGEYTLCTLAPGGAILCPGGVDIGHGQRPDEVTGQTVTAMGDGISFHEAGLGDIPEVGTDRDLVFQQASLKKQLGILFISGGYRKTAPGKRV